jgi:hypothetical protein
MRLKVLTVLCVLLLQGLASAKDIVKEPGGKTIAVILDCSSCKDPKKGKSCETGVEQGYLGGAPCGKCLLDSNYGTRIPYAYDIHFMGRLVDESGKPLGGRFVRIFLPNTWTVRTRTGDDGTFRLMLGATIERKGGPVTVDLGNRTMKKDSKAQFYAMYMMPETYKPCESSK